MSETEQHKGKARLIEKSPDEAFFKAIAEANGKTELPSYHSSFERLVLIDFGEKYVLTKKGLYEVTEHTEFDGSDDIYHAEKCGENEVSFIVRFYNGGCPFSEALEQAITDMPETASAPEQPTQDNEAKPAEEAANNEAAQAAA